MMVKDPLKDSRKEFDDKVRSSKGTKGLQKIKILKEASNIWKGV